jgi:hypothetical protein
MRHREITQLEEFVRHVHAEDIGRHIERKGSECQKRKSDEDKRVLTARTTKTQTLRGGDMTMNDVT